MASEIVTRAAKAYADEGSRSLHEDGVVASHEQKIRAAIEAMREPTQGMLKYADDAAEGSGFWTLPPWEAWPVMIDAALKGEA